jgi:hypothetical protein
MLNHDTLLTKYDRSSSTLSLAPPTFNSPHGFKSSKAKAAPSPTVSSLLSNLEGKQIFHIAAPAFLPLSEVKEVSLAKVMLGEPVLNHNGVDYGIPTEAQQNKSSQTLLLYNNSTGAYEKTNVGNIQSYNVQELVRLPAGIDPSRGGSLVPPSQDTRPSARPQPKNLKMRFHPVGSGNVGPETVGSSSESEAEQPTFRVPKSVRTDQVHKRKTDDVNESEKKRKKHSSKHDPDTAPSSSQASHGTESRGRKDGDKSKKSSKHRDETSQERRARKEERKRRKAEKTQE